LNFRRAFVNPWRADFPIEVFQQMPALQRSCAVQLYGLVHHELRGLGREQLRHRGPAGQVLFASVIRGRCGVHEQPSGFGAGGHFRQRMRDSLLLRQRSAERLSRRGVVHRRVQRGLRHADRERADARPEQVQSPHGDGETAVLFTE
jgi:hypothetical protein